MVAIIALLVIASWYVWGFLVQGVNNRRGFTGDWFLGGFLSVVAAPLGILYFVKSGAALFTTPMVYFAEGGWVSILLCCGAVLTFLLPIGVLLVAALRPNKEA